MKKIVIFLLILILSGCSTISNEQTLIVGMELAYPPFETKNDNGEAIGVSVDIAKAFGEYLGVEVEIQNINWTGLIPALETEKADMVISSMTITEKRKESVSFSDPYANAYLAFLVNKSSSITNASELNASGKIIAVKTGSTGDFYVSANYPEATILRLDDESAAMAEVLNERADAFIYDQLTIYRNVEANNTTLSALYIDNQEAENWGAAFKLDNPLRDQFNTFLEEFKANGGFEAITEKYLKEEKAQFDQYGFTFFFD